MMDTATTLSTKASMGDQASFKEASELPPADIKLIILGDSAVGKSKMVERFLLDNYEEKTSSTHALTMFRTTQQIEGEEIKIDIWDTAGQEAFNSIHPSYYFGAHTCVLVFDAKRKITYTNLKIWYKEMRKYCPKIPCILVANKIDIDKRVTERNYKFAEQHNLPFIFVSAADGTNVVKTFREAITRGLDYKKNPPEDYYSTVLNMLQEDDFFGEEEDEK